MPRMLKVIGLAFGLWLAALAPAGATCIGLGCSCSISASALSFGTYNPLAAGDVDATGNVSVTCGALLLGANISYEVTLSAGGSGDQLGREMANGAETLQYNLYTTAARTVIWGDGAGGAGTITNSYLLTLLFARTDNFPVYGRLPAGQNVSAGAYSDTIVATVAF